MSKIWSFIEFLQKKLAWSVLSFMLLGVLYGTFFNATPLKGLIIPLTFLMVYPVMVTLKMNELLERGGEKANVIALVLNFGIMPFIAFGIGKVFFADSPLMIVGILLSALLPTSGMTISWTSFAKGNVHSAIKMTIIGLIVGSVATPFYIKMLAGATITIPVKDVFNQIILIVFLPMILGYLSQKVLIKIFGEKKFSSTIKSKFPTLSTLGVLGVVFVAMAIVIFVMGIVTYFVNY